MCWRKTGFPKRLSRSDSELRFGLLQEYDIGIGVAANHTQAAAVERPVKVLYLF